MEPSHCLYLHRKAKTQRQECSRWHSNPRSYCSSGTRRPAWVAKGREIPFTTQEPPYMYKGSAPHSVTENRLSGRLCSIELTLNDWSLFIPKSTWRSHQNIRRVKSCNVLYFGRIPNGFRPQVWRLSQIWTQEKQASWNTLRYSSSQSFQWEFKFKIKYLSLQ
jgi:hypothetical protein